MSKKLTLEIDDTIDYTAIAIVCNLPDYQFVYHLNNAMDSTFEHKNPFTKDFNDARKSVFPKFEFVDANNMTELFLLSNKHNGNILFSDLKNIDFVLLIRGEETELYVANVNAIIRKVKNVQISKVFDPNSLKNFDSFIFEFENQLEDEMRKQEKLKK